MKWILGIVLALLLTLPVTVFGDNVYDDRAGDGTLVDAPDSDVACVTHASDTVTINARSFCIENLAASTAKIIFACDAHPTRGTGTTLRAGLAPGERTCVDLTNSGTSCKIMYVCGADGTSATFTLRYLK